MTALASEAVTLRLSGRRAVALAGWLVAAFALVAAAAWLAKIPPSLSSDDALFLLHALTRFSILDFSPQFPGYPGYVAMGRAALLITRDPLTALALTSSLIALAIPPAAAWVAWRITRAPWAALATFFVTLAGPLMPDLAVSLLTDGAGVLFFLVFLALLPAGVGASASAATGERVRLRLLLAGLALGWAFACRPSDAPLYAGALAAVAVFSPRRAAAILAASTLILVPVAVVICAVEGPALYWQEGLRFLSGHATLWGNTPFAAAGDHVSWIAALAAIPFAIPVAVLILAGVIAAILARPRVPAFVAAITAFIVHAVWIVAFQNPDHLRHLAPLAILGGILFVVALSAEAYARVRVVAVAVLVAGEIAVLAAAGVPFGAVRPPPLAAAEMWIADRQIPVVATNEGVFTLRAGLPGTRIYDAHYAGDASLGLSVAAGFAFRLTGTRLEGVPPAAVFPARFPGERTLWLYPASLAK